ncbi:hypothetical protein AAG570_002238 [Ranatra chinensis]|uniref:Kazal-like domain-containing protein n=1 Tax=Ranatra chinensis TaxID=642074 RepID=A0ABD0Y6X8_9HEMI
MASKRRNMFHKNKTQETTEKVFGTSSSQSCQCNIACPFIYDPVCATNGFFYVTFPNLCSVNAQNICCGDLCGMSYGQIGPCGIFCPIEFVYTPYCAFDRYYRLRTFGSRCLLNAYNKCYGHIVLWFTFTRSVLKMVSNHTIERNTDQETTERVSLLAVVLVDRAFHGLGKCSGTDLLFRTVAIMLPVD